jgi:hypothetical protein
MDQLLQNRKATTTAGDVSSDLSAAQGDKKVRLASPPKNSDYGYKFQAKKKIV